MIMILASAMRVATATTNIIFIPMLSSTLPRAMILLTRIRVQGPKISKSKVPYSLELKFGWGQLLPPLLLRLLLLLLLPPLPLLIAVVVVVVVEV